MRHEVLGDNLVEPGIPTQKAWVLMALCEAAAPFPSLTTQPVPTSLPAVSQKLSGSQERGWHHGYFGLQLISGRTGCAIEYYVEVR